MQHPHGVAMPFQSPDRHRSGQLKSCARLVVCCRPTQTAMTHAHVLTHCIPGRDCRPFVRHRILYYCRSCTTSTARRPRCLAASTPCPRAASSRCWRRAAALRRTPSTSSTGPTTPRARSRHASSPSTVAALARPARSCSRRRATSSTLTWCPDGFNQGRCCKHA